MGREFVERTREKWGECGNEGMWEINGFGLKFGVDRIFVEIGPAGWSTGEYVCIFSIHLSARSCLSMGLQCML